MMQFDPQEEERRRRMMMQGAPMPPPSQGMQQPQGRLGVGDQPGDTGGGMDFGQFQQPDPRMIEMARYSMSQGGGRVPPVGPGGTPQPQGSESSDFDSNYLVNALQSSVVPDYLKQFGPNMTRGQGTNDKLRMFYEDPRNPESPYGSDYNAIQQSLAQRTQRTAPTSFGGRYQRGSQDLAAAQDAASGFAPKFQKNIDYLNEYGLPGKDQIEGEMSRLGGRADRILGGNGSYGVDDLLSQVLEQGLPGQRDIENTTRGQNTRGTTKQSEFDALLNDLAGLDTGTQTGSGKKLLTDPIRTTTPGSTKKLGGVSDKLLERDYEDVQADPLQTKGATRIDEALDKGGLTDEFVSASRNKILKPSTEALYERLNKQGGGVASMSSGLMAELDRRNEADFNDSMVLAGYDNYDDLLGRATDYGEQVYQQDYGRKKLGLDSQKLGVDSLQEQAGLETDLAKSDVDAIIESLKTGSGLMKDAYSQKYNTAGLFGDAGDSSLDRALKGYDTTSSAAFPYVDLAADQGSRYLDQGLGRFDSLSKYGLQNIDTVGKWGYKPMEMGLDYGLAEREAEQAERRLGQGERGMDMDENQFDTTSRMNLLDMLLGGSQKYLTGEQAAGLGQNEQLMQLLDTVLKGEYQLKGKNWWDGLL